MKIALRLFLIIGFVSPLSCSKLSVTWTRAIVAFWIFFCRFRSRKSAIFWVLLSCENNSLFASGTDSFGQFSGTSGFSDFSINWSRVNLVCHLNSLLSGRLSGIFGPVWLSTSSSKSIWLSISPVSDWSLVELLGASCPSISFEGLFCFVKGNVCCCCINNWASASELASKEFVDLFCFLGLLYSVDDFTESLLLLLELLWLVERCRFLFLDLGLVAGICLARLLTAFARVAIDLLCFLYSSSSLKRFLLLLCRWFC